MQLFAEVILHAKLTIWAEKQNTVALDEPETTLSVGDEFPSTR